MKSLNRALSAGALIVAVGLARTTASAQQRPSVADAVHKGHAVGHERDGVKAVRAALFAGGDVNQIDASGWTPLMHACLECRGNIVELLLEHGANVSLRASSTASSFMSHGQSALNIAASCFIARRRAELAPERGMPETYAQTELAAPEKIVRKLIRAGANVNGADADGETSLMMAVMQSWVGVVRELLAAGPS